MTEPTSTFLSETISKPGCQFMKGLQAGIPVILGYIPVGIAYGIMAREAGFTAGETILMSLTVYAGASQMMAAGMYGEAAGSLAIILTTFILNLRHLIMSTCIVHKIGKAPLGLKLLGAFGVTDESFAVFTTQPKAFSTIYFYLGLVLGTYSSWVIGSALGAFASGLLPPIVSASFGIALYAMFIGLLVPNLKGNSRLALLVVLTAFFNMILSRFMASAWALIAATLLCAFLGVFFVDLPDETSTDAAGFEDRNRRTK